MLLFGVTILATVPQRSEISEGLMYYPVYSTLYHPTENLALDEVIVKFKSRVVFWQQIPKKH
jgi:hypothetical protein